MGPLEIELLWLGYESDEAGLWEAPWQRDGSLRSLGGPSRAEVAEAIILLADRGLIEVLAGPESIDFEDANAIEPEEVRELLEDPRAWRVAEIGEFTVRYRTTDAGLVAYRGATGWTDDPAAR